MEKMTYKEFDEEMKKIGLTTKENDLNISVYSDGTLMAAVNKNVIGMMTTYYGSFEWLDQIERYVLTVACYKLTMTHPSDREGPKKYYLKIRPEYLPFFNSYNAYLNVVRHTGGMLIFDRENLSLCKTVFTEDEINELAERYDLSIFERVEVEDD